MKPTLFLLAALMLARLPSHAALVTLTNGNSQADFNTTTQANMFNWSVDGNDLLAQQAFWYRIGSAGPEQSVHPLPIGAQGTTGTNALHVLYNGTGVSFDFNYTLTGFGAGSGMSNMHEVIQITNTSTDVKTIHFFMYSDFDLSAADTVNLIAPTVFLQTGGTRLVETVVSATPNGHAAAFFPVTLNQLNDGVASNFSGPDSVGPGDTTWVFQWDLTLNGGNSFNITADKNIGFTTFNSAPEPGTWIFLSGGLLALAITRRSRS